MIDYYTGKPGNGKSLHAAEEVYKALCKGKNVIANFPINGEVFKNKNPDKLGHFIYVSNYEWLHNAYRFLPSGQPHYSYIDGLRNFANNFHKRGSKGQIKEHQTLLILDECQELYNNRTWNRADRLEWCSFYREHRKYGFDVILISQDDKVIDKQIRNILQFEYEHRALKYYKTFGKVLSLFFGGNLFICIKRTYSMKKSKDSRISAKYFRGKKKFYDFYNSYQTFHTESQGAR